MANSVIKDLNNDLATANGGLVFGNSDGQHITDNLLTSEGQLRHAPYIGIGIRRDILGKGTPTSLMHRVQRKLKLDLATVKTVQWINNELVIDAIW